jgi:hypothetical protein
MRNAVSGSPFGGGVHILVTLRHFALSMNDGLAPTADLHQWQLYAGVSNQTG